MLIENSRESWLRFFGKSQNMAKQKQILIVDDDPEFGAVVQQLLEVEGYSATLATTAYQASQLCAAREFAVVLLDLNLGHESGLDVLRDVKQLRENLPIILITAHGSLESAAEAVREKARKREACMDEHGGRHQGPARGIPYLEPRTHSR